MIRVFPQRTHYTPIDELAFVGDPPLWRPADMPVHVSVIFTWDIPEGERLAKAWSLYYSDVQLGGPAINGEGNGFEPGIYVKEGVTFTSRGCPNRCPWCLIDKPLTLLPIVPGYIIQDNNFLATGREHMSEVFAMLKEQPRAAIFSGGLDARLVDDWVAEQFRELRIKSVFLAADTDTALEPLQEAVDRLAFLGREKLRCYVLIGRETQDRAEARLRTVWNIGCIPFAQLYQPPRQKRIEYDKAWHDLARTWSRPAMMRALMRPERLAAVWDLTKITKCDRMGVQSNDE